MKKVFTVRVKAPKSYNQIIFGGWKLRGKQLEKIFDKILIKSRKKSVSPEKVPKSQKKSQNLQNFPEKVPKKIPKSREKSRNPEKIPKSR